jgi:hypothetical protein
MKKNEIGWEYSTYGGEDSFKERNCGKILGKYTSWKTCVKGRIILKWIFQKWDGRSDWIDVALNRKMWVAFVNAIINHRV